MSTKTQTTTTHYHIQKRRRAEFIDQWRNIRQTVIRKDDVTLVPTARGLRTGVYMGWDGDRPTRCLDALVHEVDPGTKTTIHRHSWDAILFMVEGSGWTEVDGVRYDWKAWDAIHLPAWSWHRHGNDGDTAGRFMSYSSEPTLWTLGMSLIEDAGHEPFANLPPRPNVSSGMPGDDPYARRLRRVDQEAKKRRSGRIHTPYDEQEILATPRGTRTKFLNDRAIGNQASGLTQVMIQFAPGKTQSIHRHPGEAWLYVVEGHGHSFMGIAPDNGQHYRWKKGDLIVVDHFLWHQHFNDDPVHECRLVRVHMFDSLLETMRTLMDPMVLFEEAEDTLVSMQELSQIQWPEDKRPGGLMDVPRSALPPGVLSLHVLPAEHHDRDWDAIIVPREVKERLLAQALLVLQHGRKLSMLSGLPHGLIVLAGPPGTGKTTMARGLAQVAALALARQGATALVEVNPHAFPSDMLGESQRNVTRLLTETIPEIAARRPFVIVLIDEVESFAVRRSSASFEANPVDVHRATDAVLLGIDEIAKNLPSVLFVTTTNFMQAVDEAFLSRADLVMTFSLPDRETVGRILAHALGELAVQWPALLPLTRDEARLAELAGLCEGWDGRRIRKLVLAALAQRLDVARDPATLSWDDLLSAARKKGGVEWAGGRALTSREMFPDVPKELMHDHDHGHGPHRHTHTHQKDEV